ncbi:uncharacterized protein LOC113873760 [Abrus precatorius]|uniref:Uncharacterized protein LOC113873760 n=1 Tax=Abrus precatorius TaxID=3816 RepID=A0A8B8MJV3_ABRPR|nr:uncharacterized protein LOC113873760 [Abrus precatorius]
MIPACFSQPNTPSSSSITQVPQNLVTCIYQTHLCNSPTYLTLTWSRTLLSHSLTIYAPHTFSITIPLKPSTFSFFRTRPGSKSIYLSRAHKHSRKIKLFWDFAGAQFSAQNCAEPESCFYLAICCNGRLEFFLGDLLMQFTNHQHSVSEQSLVSRREHVFGSESYVSRGEFMGSKHEIEIELCNGDVLRVKVDGEVHLVVKRLAWKFRGNEKIFIDGVEVEFYWDVLSWVVDHSENGNGNGNGVFVFQVGDGGAVWPEMVGPEKKLMKKRLVGPNMSPAIMTLLPSPSSSGVWQWTEESSDGGRSSCSSSTRSCGINGGFSLLLYAWKRN